MPLNDDTSLPEIYTVSDHHIRKEHVDKKARSIISKLNEAGHKAYIVGGFVRDSLMGKNPKDCDIVTNATPEEIKEIIPRTRIIGRRFKIVHARAGKEIIEISTFRSSSQKDTKKSNKGILLRDNNYGTIEEDAFRRDFTINSLYLDIERMEVLDFVGGFKDLQEGISDA